MITATFDLTGGWTFDGDASSEFGVRFVSGKAERLYPNGLAYGFTVKVGTKNTETYEWPPSNIVVRELSPNRLFHHRVDAKPDAKVTLKVWAKESGRKVEGEFKFTMPRPPQPYPSWTWDDGWHPPVPYPDDDLPYVWDETEQAWAPYEDD